MTKSGITVKKHMLGNEASEEFLQTIEQQGIEYQKVPLHRHHQNAAEKAISTFKDHFTAILVGVDKNFPRHLWDRLLPQAESTLNMLRATNIAPKILAYAYIYGQHDFNRVPLAPLGCTVLIHNEPTTRKTWENHASEGYYIKTSREHFRCYKTWTTKTRSIQVADTVFFKHQYITMPTVSKVDTIVAAAN